MHHESFVSDLAIVLGVAALTGLVFRLLRQPSILGYLCAGLIVGPYLPLPLFADPGRVQALSEFGVVLVMFAVGLEFRLEKFFRVLPVSGFTGLLEISALFLSGYWLGLAIGWSKIGALFLGACLCISSTMAVSKIFEQRPVAEDVRSSVFGVLVLQDVAAIALIAIMTALSRGANAEFGDVMLLLGKLVAALVFIIVLGMFVIPRAVRLVARTKSTETMVVGTVGLCFSLALLAEKLGYSAALGAFLAGILVAESGLGKKVEHATAPIRDLFAAVFFVSIGMSVDPVLAMRHLPTALVVLCVVVFGQFVSVLFGGLLSGTGLRRSVTAGLALGQIGEFAFILAQIGRKAWVVGPELQPILVTVAVLSTFTTSLFLRYAEPITRTVEHLLPGRVRRILTVYESWFDRLRRRPTEKANGVSLVLRALVIDLLLAASIVFAFLAWREELEIALQTRFHLGQELVHNIPTLVLGLALFPILVLMALTARKLASRLLERVFPEGPSSARSLLQAALAVVLVASVGLLGAGLLAPVVGAGYVSAAFVLALLATIVALWRRAGVLDNEIKASGSVLMQVIVDQGLPEAERETAHPLALTDFREVTLSSRDHAIGQTLAELRLRSLTGANVVGLRRPGGLPQSPTGVEILAEGDTLFIAGCQVDQEAASQLLTLGAQDRKDSRDRQDRLAREDQDLEDQNLEDQDLEDQQDLK